MFLLYMPRNSSFFKQKPNFKIISSIVKINKKKTGLLQKKNKHMGLGLNSICKPVWIIGTFRLCILDTIGRRKVVFVLLLRYLLFKAEQVPQTTTLPVLSFYFGLKLKTFTKMPRLACVCVVLQCGILSEPKPRWRPLFWGDSGPGVSSSLFL